MRLHRFYVTEKINDQSEIEISSSELVHQIRDVFRQKSGDSVIILDGSGLDYECSIIKFTKENISLKLIKKSNSHYMPARDIYLCAAVIKKDNFEWVVEKATELGVTNIIPVMAERSEKKSLNELRLKKIAIEASEQSGRGSVPMIKNVMTLDEVFKTVSDLNTAIVADSRTDPDARACADLNIALIAFHTEGDLFDQNARAKLMENNLKKSPLFIFIGPEGGWSSKEIEMFHKNRTAVYCLGSQVLRSETAVIATLAQIIF